MGGEAHGASGPGPGVGREGVGSAWRAEWVTVGAVWVVAAVFAWAAWSKATEPWAVGPTLAWLGVPWGSVPAAAGALVAFEAALAGWLVMRPSSRVPRGAAAVTLLLFSVVLVWMAAGGSGVSCGCMGSAGGDPVRENLFGVGRNAAMIGLLLAPGWRAE